MGDVLRAWMLVEVLFFICWRNELLAVRSVSSYFSNFHCPVPATSPQNLMVIAASANSLNLSWFPLPPVDVNGELDWYRVDYRIIEQLEFGTDIPENVSITNTESVEANTTFLTIDGLDNYTVYEVNVSAVTVGVGPAATETQRTDENGE